MIYTTLNEIRAFSPCKSGWQTLLASLNKIEADDEPLSMLHILESNGINDAIWCMRVNWFENKSLYMKFVSICTAATAAATAATAAAAAAVEREFQTEILKQLLLEHTND